MAQGDPAEQLAVVSVCLLDTGPLIAALDRTDPAHACVSRALESFRGTLLTTGAVVTEAMHLLTTERDGPSRLVNFLGITDTTIWDIFMGERLGRCAALMKKYADVPMDFADATLVVMAEDAGVADILTLDERGFRTFRYLRNKRFRLALDGFR